MKRFLAILHARNMEFIRDRSSLGWNILFPLLLVLGFAVVFSGEPKAMFKVGVLGDPSQLRGADAASFFKTKYIQFIPVDDLGQGHRQGRAFPARHAGRPARGQALLDQ